MYRAFLLGLAMLLLGSRVGFSTEQTVEPIVPRGEQVVQPVASSREQVVERMGTGTDEQQVGVQEPPSAVAKAASTAGKVVTGVAAAGVSLGAMAAMLLLL